MLRRSICLVWIGLLKIELSSRHLLNLINDVQDMPKIKSEKMTLALEPFSLSELVEGALAIGMELMGMISKGRRRRRA